LRVKLSQSKRSSRLMVRIISLIGLLLYTCSLCVYADITKQWRYWTSADNLTESYCPDITISPNGYVWISHGDVPTVSRLDGYTVRKIPAPRRSSPVIVESDSGEKWAYLIHRDGRFGGFQQYVRGDWVEHPFPEKSLLSGYTPKFYPIEDSKIIAVFPQELVLYDIEKNQSTILKKANNTGLLQFNEIIFGQKSTYFWISASNGVAKVTIHLLSPDVTIEWKEYPFPKAWNLQNLMGTWEDSSGILYSNSSSLTEQKTIFLQLKNDTWNIVQQTDKNFFLVSPAGDNNFWHVTFENPSLAGAMELSLKFQAQTYSIKMPRNRVLSGLVTAGGISRSGMLWISTPYGLAQYSPPIWRVPSDIPDRNFYCTTIIEDKQGNIWFHEKKTLLKYDNQSWKQIELVPDYQPLEEQYETTTLCLLADGRIAIRSGDSFLWLMDPQTETFEKVIHPEGKKIDLIAPKSNGELWVHTITDPQSRRDRQSQIESFDGEKFTPVLSRRNPIDRMIGLRHVYEDTNGDLWCGGITENRLALISADNRRIRHTGYPGNAAFSVLRVNQNRLWASDRDSIFEYDGRDWKMIKSGLDQIPTMIKARDGSVWVASWNGVHRYDKNSWITNDVNDGLPDAVVKTIFQDSKGRIWVGTSRGIARYHPDADVDPPIANLGKSLDRVGPNGNAQFLMLGMDKWRITETDRLLYSYKIDDEEWSPYTSETIASYEGLTPGIHSFSIRSIDRNWNVSREVSHPVFVSHRWYQQTGFYIVMAISILAIAFFITLAISRHLKVNHYINQLHTTNNQLYEANERLLEIDKIKTSFVSQASHDLRTPLTGIKGSLDNLLLGIAGEMTEKQIKILNRALKSVDRLSHLVTDLLDLSRIESGRTVLEKSRVPLRILIDNVIQEHSLAAQQKDIHVSTVDIPNKITIYADGSKMQRVIGELFHNAIKYTPEEGTIHVHVTKDANEVRISIKDSGIGLTEEEQKRVFSRFYRSNAAQNMAKGSGLGLSIIKEIVEMHEGTITIQSQKDRGSTFTVTLPIEKKES
jgi:signal transduction histidine kinase/streptogramin lyase